MERGRQIYMEDKLTLLLNLDFDSLNETLQEEIYREVYHLVYRIAFYMTKDHSMSEDIIQEVFIKTVYKVPKIQDEQKIRAWIKVTAKNLTLNYLKKNKKNRNQEDVQSVYNDGEKELIEKTSIEKEVEKIMLQEAIKTSLLEINPDYRMLIELKWHKNLTYEEIADALGISKGAVKQKLHRARESLRIKLNQKWGFEDE